jgi:SagB-type dehydrogenase family enzyme
MSTGAEESRPRLCDGLVILPAAGGLLIEGGPRRHLLTGAAAASVVRKMLPLLDGQHTLGRLAAALDLPAGRVQQAVRLLDQCGLLEEGASLPPGALSPAPDVALSLSRHVNVTRVRRRAGALAAALADSAVLLTAPPAIARPVADDLRAAGVGQVMCSPRLRSRDMRAVASAQRGMVVMEDDPENEGQSADVEDACRDQGAALLRFATRRGRVEIGPLFYRDYTACYTCFRGGYGSVTRDHPGAPATTAGRHDAETGWLAAGLVTGEILAVLAQVTAPRSFRMLTVTSVPGLDSSRYVVAPRPDCPVCGLGGPAAGGHGETADAYEWLVQDPPAELWPTAEIGSRPEFEALQSQRPEFPASPTHPLPPPADIRPPAGMLGFGQAPLAPAGIIDEATIAGILLRVAGQQRHGGPGPGRRWAATGGNLASAEAYLLAGPSQFPDLPGSIFRYDDIGHGLVAVRRSPVPLAQCLAGTGLTAPPVQLAIVLVGAVGRVRQKYDTFAYRLTHLDAGCAAAQLAAVGRGYGLTVSFAPRWDDHLADLLELYPGGEIITAVAGIAEPESQPCR